MKWSDALALLMWASLLAGCAANRSAEEGQTSRRQTNLLTAAEIQQENRAQHAFDLIRALRPNWLQIRGVQSLGSPSEQRPGEREPTTRTAVDVMVYVDGLRMGGPGILRQILASDIQEARYLGPTEASARFGTDHTGGAILITTQQR